MKKILLSRTDGIGDVLLITPLIKEAKKVFDSVSVMVSPYSKDILKNNPDVDEIIIFNKKKLKQLIKYIQSKKFDVGCVVYPRFLIGYLFFKSKIKERVGTAYRWYSFLFFNNRKKIHRKYSIMHEADYNLMLLKDYIGEKKADRLYYYIKEEEIKFAHEYIKNKGIKNDFLIIYPGGKGSASNLSEKKYADIINLLDRKYSILIAKGKNEDEKVDKVYGYVKNKNNVFLMKEDLTIRELAGVIKLAKLFISGSTGPMHIASALKVNTLSFFPEKGSTNHIRWGPLGNKSEIITFNNEDDIDLKSIIPKIYKLRKD